MQAALTSFPTLMSELMQCCKDQRSGYMHIVTDQNHKISVGLLQGKIVSLQYRIRRGQRALEDILKVQSGRYDFKEAGAVNADEPPLPETDDILRMFGIDEASIQGSKQAVSQATTTQSSTGIHAVDRAVLQEALVKYVGPVAPIMSKSVFATASSTSEAIEMLAAKIPDASQAQAFKQEVRAELG